jgi:hypothetical protein
MKKIDSQEEIAILPLMILNLNTESSLSCLDECIKECDSDELDCDCYAKSCYCDRLGHEDDEENQDIDCDSSIDKSCDCDT